jgi:hypothetical protein
LDYASWVQNLSYNDIIVVASDLDPLGGDFVKLVEEVTAR